MSGKQKKQLLRIGVAAAAFAAATLIGLEGIGRLVVYLAVYTLIGWDIVWRALRYIVRCLVYTS